MDGWSCGLQALQHAVQFFPGDVKGKNMQQLVEDASAHEPVSDVMMQCDLGILRHKYTLRLAAIDDGEDREGGEENDAAEEEEIFICESLRENTALEDATPTEEGQTITTPAESDKVLHDKEQEADRPTVLTYEALAGFLAKERGKCIKPAQSKVKDAKSITPRASYSPEFRHCRLGLFVSYNKTAWMGEEAMLAWVDNILRPAATKRKILLVLDSAPSHRDDRVLRRMKLYCTVAMIPGKTTLCAQYLDVYGFAAFKQLLHNQLDNLKQNQRAKADSDAQREKFSERWYREAFSSILSSVWKSSIENTSGQTILQRFQRLGYVLPLSGALDSNVRLALAPSITFTGCTLDKQHPFLDYLRREKPTSVSLNLLFLSRPQPEKHEQTKRVKPEKKQVTLEEMFKLSHKRKRCVQEQDTNPNGQEVRLDLDKSVPPEKRQKPENKVEPTEKPEPQSPEKKTPCNTKRGADSAKLHQPRPKKARKGTTCGYCKKQTNPPHTKPTCPERLKDEAKKSSKKQ